MTTVRKPRPPAREAPPELLVLAKWEEFVGWLFDRAAKWPKSARFTLTQRVENFALEVLDLLVIARYEPRERPAVLKKANLLLERLRFLFRVARNARVMPISGFESALRRVDETGRMIHGWRQNQGQRHQEGEP